jgi:hypothetical protein
VHAAGICAGIVGVLGAAFYYGCCSQTCKLHFSCRSMPQQDVHEAHAGLTCINQKASLRHKCFGQETAGNLRSGEHTNGLSDCSLHRQGWLLQQNHTRASACFHASYHAISRCDETSCNDGRSK